MKEIHKDRIPDELLNTATRLHGHLGPFLVVGIRMTLLAERILRAKPTSCQAMVTKKRPLYCAIDGIKAVMGENTVAIKEGTGLVAEFSCDEKKKVTLRPIISLLEKYIDTPWELCEEYAREVMFNYDNYELFEEIGRGKF